MGSRLRSSLRQFFLKVHPDVFASTPHQRAVNEVSFQRLQALIQWSQQPTGPSPLGRGTSLEFYVRADTSSRPATRVVVPVDEYDVLTKPRIDPALASDVVDFTVHRLLAAAGLAPTEPPATPDLERAKSAMHKPSSSIPTSPPSSGPPASHAASSTPADEAETPADEPLSFLSNFVPPVDSEGRAVSQATAAASTARAAAAASRTGRPAALSTGDEEHAGAAGQFLDGDDEEADAQRRAARRAVKRREGRLGAAFAEALSEDWKGGLVGAGAGDGDSIATVEDVAGTVRFSGMVPPAELAAAYETLVRLVEAPGQGAWSVWREVGLEVRKVGWHDSLGVGTSAPLQIGAGGAAELSGGGVMGRDVNVDVASGDSGANAVAVGAGDSAAVASGGEGAEHGMVVAGMRGVPPDSRGFAVDPQMCCVVVPSDFTVEELTRYTTTYATEIAAVGAAAAATAAAVEAAVAEACVHLECTGVYGDQSVDVSLVRRLLDLPRGSLEGVGVVISRGKMGVNRELGIVRFDVEAGEYADAGSVGHDERVAGSKATAGRGGQGGRGTKKGLKSVKKRRHSRKKGEVEAEAQAEAPEWGEVARAESAEGVPEVADGGAAVVGDLASDEVSVEADDECDAPPPPPPPPPPSFEPVDAVASPTTIPTALFGDRPFEQYVASVQHILPVLRTSHAMASALRERLRVEAMSLATEFGVLVDATGMADVGVVGAAEAAALSRPGSRSSRVDAFLQSPTPTTALPLVEQLDFVRNVRAMSGDLSRLGVADGWSILASPSGHSEIDHDSRTLSLPPRFSAPHVLAFLREQMGMDHEVGGVYDHSGSSTSASTAAPSAATDAGVGGEGGTEGSGSAGGAGSSAAAGDAGEADGSSWTSVLEDVGAGEASVGEGEEAIGSTPSASVPPSKKLRGKKRARVQRGGGEDADRDDVAGQDGLESVDGLGAEDVELAQRARAMAQSAGLDGEALLEGRRRGGRSGEDDATKLRPNRAAVPLVGSDPSVTSLVRSLRQDLREAAPGAVSAQRFLFGQAAELPTTLAAQWGLRPLTHRKGHAKMRVDEDDLDGLGQSMGPAVDPWMRPQHTPADDLMAAAKSSLLHAKLEWDKTGVRKMLRAAHFAEFTSAADALRARRRRRAATRRLATELFTYAVKSADAAASGRLTVESVRKTYINPSAIAYLAAVQSGESSSAAHSIARQIRLSPLSPKTRGKKLRFADRIATLLVQIAFRSLADAVLTHLDTEHAHADAEGVLGGECGGPGVGSGMGGSIVHALNEVEADREGTGVGSSLTATSSAASATMQHDAALLQAAASAGVSDVSAQDLLSQLWAVQRNGRIRRSQRLPHRMKARAAVRFVGGGVDASVRSTFRRLPQRVQLALVAAAKRSEDVAGEVGDMDLFAALTGGGEGTPAAETSASPVSDGDHDRQDTGSGGSAVQSLDAAGVQEGSGQRSGDENPQVARALRALRSTSPTSSTGRKRRRPRRTEASGLVEAHGVPRAADLTPTERSQTAARVLAKNPLTVIITTGLYNGSLANVVGVMTARFVRVRLATGVYRGRVVYVSPHDLDWAAGELDTTTRKGRIAHVANVLSMLEREAGIVLPVSLGDVADAAVPLQAGMSPAAAAALRAHHRHSAARRVIEWQLAYVQQWMDADDVESGRRLDVNVDRTMLAEIADLRRWWYNVAGGVNDIEEEKVGRDVERDESGRLSLKGRVWPDALSKQHAMPEVLGLANARSGPWSAKGSGPSGMQLPTFVQHGLGKKTRPIPAAPRMYAALDLEAPKWDDSSHPNSDPRAAAQLDRRSFETRRALRAAGETRATQLRKRYEAVTSTMGRRVTSHRHPGGRLERVSAAV